MKKINALFACEHSAHYYFKHNFNADSGIIASLIVSEIISKKNKPLSKLLKEFEVYFKIEETNFEVEDKNKKLKEITGWKQEINLETGLRLTNEYFSKCLDHYLY